MSHIFVDKVSKSYNFYVHHGIFKREKKSTKAVNEVSFEINSGEVLGLIGANGAGKTTIIKMIAGVLLPDSGSILVNKENPFAKSVSYRKSVSMILGQRGKLHPDMSILESASLYGAMYKLTENESKNRVLRIAHMLSLTADDLSKQTRSLSLGQRMKGEICISFINTPTVIFLDEPTLGLDYQSSKTIRQFIKDYCVEHGATAILTSHNLRDITETCSKLLIINAGTSVYYGNISELPNKFSQDVSVSCRIPDVDTLNRVRTQYANVTIKDDCATISCRPKEINQTLNQLFALGEVLDLKITETPFEDIIEGMLNHE